MQKKTAHKTLIPLFSLILVVWMTSGVQAADFYPPRVSYLDGTAAYETAGNVDWDEVTLNLPLLSGDRIFSHLDSRLEIELGRSNFLRIGGETDVVFSQIDSKELVLELHKGEMILRLNRDQRVHVYTPHGRVEIKKDGLYRISSDPQGETRIAVRKGRAEFEGPSGETRINEGEQLYLGGQRGIQQVSYGLYSDEFDLWSDRRDARFVSSRSVAYVGGTYYPGIYDLDYYGDWAYYSGYGRVWIPRVSVGWAPYRVGRWGYLSFGWTWISHEPWGWLPYHYGDWIYHRSRWCWVPGSFNSWSPAVVNFYFGNGWVGWAPRGYYGRHRYGGNNTVVVNDNRTTIINNWNGAGAGNGLTVVSRDDFGRHRNRVDQVLQTPTRDMVRSARSGLPTDLATPRINRVASTGGVGGTRERQVTSPAGIRTTRSAESPLSSSPRVSTVRSRSSSGENEARVERRSRLPETGAPGSDSRIRPGTSARAVTTPERSPARSRSTITNGGPGVIPRPSQAAPENRNFDESRRTTVAPRIRTQPERSSTGSRSSTIRTAPTPSRNNRGNVRPETFERAPRPSIRDSHPTGPSPRSISRPTPTRRVPSVGATPRRSSPQPSINRSTPSRRSPSVRPSPAPRSTPSYRSAPRPAPRPSVSQPSRSSSPRTPTRTAPRRRPD